MKKLFAIFAVFLMFLFGPVAFAAEKLGPDVPTVFAYIAPGVAVVDGTPRLTGQLGIRRSWHPFDLVGEISLRDKPGLNLLAAKSWGDNRVLGGVALVNGAATPGVMVGVDYKHLLMRFTVYTTERTVAGSCRGYYKYRYCSPDVATAKDHAELFVGYHYPFGSK